MTTTALRPRYKFSSPDSPEGIRSRIKTALKDPERNHYSLQHRSTSNQLLIAFPARHRHFWSPTLDVNLEKAAEGKTTIRVLIGPEPSIWTMFMFFYTIGSLMTLAGFILGYSQYTLGHGPWYLFLIPGGFLVVGFFYLAAMAGKSRAQAQMHILKEFLEQAIGQSLFDDVENPGSTRPPKP